LSWENFSLVGIPQAMDGKKVDAMMDKEPVAMVFKSERTHKMMCYAKEKA
jgi:hypothetical protein